MSLQDLLKKILDDAAVEAEKILAEAEEQKKVVAEEFVQKGKAEKSDLDDKTKKALEAVEDKTKSMARRENAKMLLDVKQRVIQKALADFLARLEGADAELYGKVLDKLFEQISLDSGKVHAPEARLEVTKKHAPKGFDVVADKEITGGFVLKSGKSEIDNSFQNLVFAEYHSEFTTYFAEQLKLV